MDKLVLVFVCLFAISPIAGKEFPALDHIRPSASPEEQAKAAQDLISRVLGPPSNQFKVVIEGYGRNSVRDTFNIVSTGQMVTITATSGVAASMGFYYFLKTKCGCQYTWAGAQLSLPSPLPVIPSPGLTVTSHDRFRYYQNVCTVSYSSVWWDWARWERHIDWMAMNGINLPLAFTGQEAIFQKVYKKMGFTDKDLDEHFGGPAFLAWARMGNIRGWGGPLPQNWINNQLHLQYQILNRTRSLGMIPVLPGFAGHVPMAITRIFPNASVSRLDDWGRFNQTYCWYVPIGFSSLLRLFPNASVSRLGDWNGFNQTYCCTYLLDFEDPLFIQIGTAFINEMRITFGVDHIYNADSFNEMTPKSSDPSYLQRAGQAVYRAMHTADTDAIWLMQGWLFQSSFWHAPQIKALLTSVPQGKMIVLDLFAEISPIYWRTESFYGQPFIWCMLHDFGGVMELYGDMDSVNNGPFIGRSFTNSTMIGTGLTPEGIFQNEVIYELMNENAIAPQPRNITAWLTQYHSNRYGKYNADADSAWQLLKRSVYTAYFKHHGKNGYLKRPSLKPFVRKSVYSATAFSPRNAHVMWKLPFLTPNTKKTINDKLGVYIHEATVVFRRPTVTPYIHIWYNPMDLYTAWKHILNASQDLSKSDLFRYDLVDISRNSLQILSLKFYTDLVSAYRSKNMAKLQQASSELLSLLNDLDRLLGSDSHYLLGTWIKAARDNGMTDQEKDMYEFNARNQITLWGPRGEIRDYAAKQWSGLISGYYYKRWSVFINLLKNSLAKGTSWNQTIANQMMFEQAELPFNQERNVYPVTPTGDSVAIATYLYGKYKPILQDEFFYKVSGWSSLGRKYYMRAARKWTVKRWKKMEILKRKSLRKNVYNFEQI